MDLSPSVAVVILNWNGRRFLEQFLPSVLATRYNNLKVVVADNASTDDSVSFVAQQFASVEIIRLQENYGFARGYNEALKRVSADYYVLLNTDVEVTPDWLTPMIALLESNPEFVACQPKLLAYDEKGRFEYAGAAGGWIDAFGYPFSRGRVFEECEVDRGQYNSVQEVFWASGAALVIRSAMFHKAGGFDDYFFAHQEEIDLCWRVQLLGGRVLCCPESVVYHVGGGTLPKGNSRKTFLNFRNNQIMLAKNLPLREKVWKIPLRLVLDQVSAFKELLSGHGGYFVAVQRAHLAFLYWVMFYNKKKKTAPKKDMKELKGVYPGLVIWDYFARGRKTFSQIFIGQ